MDDTKEVNFTILGKIPPVAATIKFYPHLTSLVLTQGDAIYESYPSHELEIMNGDEIINAVKNGRLTLGNEALLEMGDKIIYFSRAEPENEDPQVRDGSPRYAFSDDEEEYEKVHRAYSHYIYDRVTFFFSIEDGELNVYIRELTNIDMDEAFVEMIKTFLFKRLSAMQDYQHVEHGGSYDAFFKKLFVTSIPIMRIPIVHSYSTVLLHIERFLKAAFQDASVTINGHKKYGFYQRINEEDRIDQLARVEVQWLKHKRCLKLLRDRMHDI